MGRWKREKCGKTCRNDMSEANERRYLEERGWENGDTSGQWFCSCLQIATFLYGVINDSTYLSLLFFFHLFLEWYYSVNYFWTVWKSLPILRFSITRLLVLCFKVLLFFAISVIFALILRHQYSVIYTTTSIKSKWYKWKRNIQN